MDTPITLLPGQRLSAAGRLRIDYLAVATLAFPFMMNSAVQAVLNATDTWFIGRVSPTATAAIGAVYWPVLVFVLLFGGVGLAVQTLVAQAYGARRFARASQATWSAATRKQSKNSRNSAPATFPTACRKSRDFA